MSSEYGIVAGIDVHKKWLYVVIGPEDTPEGQFRRMRGGTTTRELQRLADDLYLAGVCTVVMESTAKYWRPVWAVLEGAFRLFLAQARSNAAPHGRKTDFGDAIRLIKRLRAGDLRLSFVPDMEQREWRLLTRTRVKYQNDISQLRSELEGLLEECRIKLSGCLSDVFGLSGRRILRKLAEGEADPERLAALADSKVRATPQQLADALNGKLTAAHRLLLNQTLDRLETLKNQSEEINEQLTVAMKPHLGVIRRLCAIPGISVSAAYQVIAELGPSAEKFVSAAHAASWAGVCPGRQQSAGESYSDACAKGNRFLRRLLCQCAWAAVRNKSSYAHSLFKRLVTRLGPQKAIWAVAHYLLRLIWMVLHNGIEYQERAQVANLTERLKRKLDSTARALRRFGLNVQITIPELETA